MRYFVGEMNSYQTMWFKKLNLSTGGRKRVGVREPPICPTLSNRVVPIAQSRPLSTRILGEIIFPLQAKHAYSSKLFPEEHIFVGGGPGPLEYIPSLGSSHQPHHRPRDRSCS